MLLSISHAQAVHDWSFLSCVFTILLHLAEGGVEVRRMIRGSGLISLVVFWMRCHSGVLMWLGSGW